MCLPAHAPHQLFGKSPALSSGIFLFPSLLPLPTYMPATEHVRRPRGLVLSLVSVRVFENPRNPCQNRFPLDTPALTRKTNIPYHQPVRIPPRLPTILKAAPWIGLPSWTNSSRRRFPPFPKSYVEATPAGFAIRALPSAPASS